MKKYVKSKGVFCPNCGKSHGVELLKEDTFNHNDYYIRCRHCSRLWKIIDFGAYPSYDSPDLDE